MAKLPCFLGDWQRRILCRMRPALAVRLTYLIMLAMRFSMYVRLSARQSPLTRVGFDGKAR